MLSSSMAKPARSVGGPGSLLGSPGSRPAVGCGVSFAKRILAAGSDSCSRSRTEPSSAKLVRVMVPFWFLVEDMHVLQQQQGRGRALFDAAKPASRQGPERPSVVVPGQLG